MTERPAGRLSTIEIERFRSDGALFPITALTPSEAHAAVARLESLEAERGGRLSRFANAKPHLLLPWLWALVHEPRIVDVVEDLLGPDLYCIATSFIDKPAGGEGHVAWHQDATYWGLNAPEAVTAWLALTPSTPENGCVRFVPGSHETQLVHIDSADPTNLLGARERLREPVDDSQAVDMILAPGQMSLHHVLLIHGSAHNRTAGRRVGFAIRYIPGHVWQAGGSATLVRGRDHGKMALEVAPKSDFDPAALARHADIFRRFATVIDQRKHEHAVAVAGRRT
ncbi:MAG: phytanoyl-CoA dioxygenase family protein [Bauldia sp.]|nr:phytanoyl-CoA dioxygenase family protein [Bauldia sp.]